VCDMHMDESSRILRQCVAAVILTGVVTVGSTSEAGTTVLFEQPSESGIDKNIWVAHVTKGGMPTGSFDMMVLQPDPHTSTGNLVPTSWDAGSNTGFVPTSPSTAQLGFTNQAGSSTAQMEGDTVGAYLNSRDLPTTRTNQLMMITPQYRFPPGATPVPFASSTSVLNGELDLQVPMAEGGDTYVTADLLFLDPRGTRISLGVKLFQNEILGSGVLGTLYDPSEKVYILNSPLAADQKFLTQVQGSATTTGIPWLGWRHFQWTIDQAQFAAAIKYLVATYPGKITSTDTTQYVLDEVHLNAEFHYSPAPAELGWSMQGLKVWLSD
jgi:hypothetical protein